MWNADKLNGIDINTEGMVGNSILVYKDNIWQWSQTGPNDIDYPSIMSGTGPMGPTGVVNTSIVPDTDSVYSLGMTGLRFDKLFLSGDTIILGDTEIHINLYQFLILYKVMKYF
jgi:hypothetical protein